MKVRLWFWTVKNPKPRIIDQDEAETLEKGAFKVLAPIGDSSWRFERATGQLYFLRGNAGYCCEEVPGPGPILSKVILKDSPRETHAPTQRVRARLEDKPRARARLEDKPRARARLEDKPKKTRKRLV